MPTPWLSSRCRDSGLRMQLFDRIGVALAVLLLVVLPTALHGWPSTLGGNVFTVLVLCGGLALMWWRSNPRVASVGALGLFLAVLAMGGGWFPDTGLALYSASFAVLALGWSGRAAWLVALCALAYLVPLYYLAEMGSWVAALMFTVPPYAAGTVLRLRKETADELAVRAQELEDERELFAEIALRHERARIASELHDIVGHAISVMVIQAAAGQRLVDADPVRAKEAFAAISESARQGTKDLERLIELLGGREAFEGGGPDLSLVDEVVARAGRSGLNVTCRFEGDRDRVPAPVAQLAFRVVQESLTNALRYAPGAEVRIVISVDQAEHGLAVRIENDRGAQHDAALAGTGRGLIGLRERIQTLGGQFSAGRTRVGGWTVEARLPGG
jgi:signal transduction histidine kinase